MKNDKNEIIFKSETIKQDSPELKAKMLEQDNNAIEFIKKFEGKQKFICVIVIKDENELRTNTTAGSFSTTKNKNLLIVLDYLKTYIQEIIKVYFSRD